MTKFNQILTEHMTNSVTNGYLNLIIIHLILIFDYLIFKVLYRLYLNKILFQQIF